MELSVGFSGLVNDCYGPWPSGFGVFGPYRRLTRLLLLLKDPPPRTMAVPWLVEGRVRFNREKHSGSEDPRGRNSRKVALARLEHALDSMAYISYIYSLLEPW